MSSDHVVINLRERTRRGGDGLHPTDGSAPSEDAMASAFVGRFGHQYRYVSTWHRWLKWDGKRWVHDATGNVFALIRQLVHEAVGGTRHERRTATAGYIAGVERLARYDQSIVVLPADLDADPWLLNTQSGIVDLRSGSCREHDPAALMTRLTGAAPNAVGGGSELWDQFLKAITQDDAELSSYLQRLGGYCVTGATSEDVLPYFFGVGSNGKSSFAEALAAALGDYAMVFAPEVLMEAKGERHPTELAQFMGVRLALCSEPSSSATWNDSRVKSLTGDAVISARFMRGDHFSFPRTHKTIVVGNHMPKLNAVSHAIRRRVQMVPFRAVFPGTPGPGMRERLKEEALGAVLAWAIAGTVLWQQLGTAPPERVRLLTEDYLGDEDSFGQWLAECCQRDEQGLERSSELHRNYLAWCAKNGAKPESNALLSRYLVAGGFSREKTMVGRCFRGLSLRRHDAYDAS
jgi:P4 family phage/plasmid primase-like protien